MKTVNINDVAKHADVSPTTVSRVLKNAPYVRVETRKKVLKVVQDLEYIPDARARSLRVGKSNILGVLVPDGLNPFYHELVTILEDIAYKEGYGVLLCNSRNNIARELAYINFLQMQKVAAIVIVTVGLKGNEINKLVNRSIPIVLLDRDIPGAEVPFIATDNYYGGIEATQYLIDLGHREIACVKGFMGSVSNRERFRGYQETLKKNNLNIHKDLMLEVGDLTYQNAYKSAQRWLKKKRDRFTAVFCLNDFAALGVLRAIQEDHGNIPSDYSVIGFDNIYLSSFSNPPLTTIAQPLKKMAINVFEAIKKWKKRGFSKYKGRRLLKPKLIVRSSCSMVDIDHNDRKLKQQKSQGVPSEKKVEN